MAEELSGQITIAAAGTAEQGPSTPTGNAWALRAHPDNVGTVWVGNDGADDVTVDNGMLIGDIGIVVRGQTLSRWWFDSTANGDIVMWLKAE
jgi:hypothetical protein